MNVGEIWHHKKAPKAWRIELIEYLGNDIWKTKDLVEHLDVVEFRKLTDEVDSQVILEQTAWFLTMTLDGDYIYENFEKEN